MNVHTPPAIAKMLAIKVDKVHAWIHAGELKAVNVAQKRSGRPRWRVLDEHLEEFLRSRQSVQPTPPRRRKTKVCAGNQYF